MASDLLIPNNRVKGEENLGEGGKSDQFFQHIFLHQRRYPANNNRFTPLLTSLLLSRIFCFPLGRNTKMWSQLWRSKRWMAWSWWRSSQSRWKVCSAGRLKLLRYDHGAMGRKSSPVSLRAVDTGLLPVPGVRGRRGCIRTSLPNQMPAGAAGCSLWALSRHWWEDVGVQTRECWLLPQPKVGNKIKTKSRNKYEETNTLLGEKSCLKRKILSQVKIKFILA